MQKSVWLLLGLIASSSALGCESMAQTELERVFCKVKTGDPGALRVSLQDFRKNPPKTQRLLLMRPAKAAGISLPQAESAPAPASPARLSSPAANASEPVPQQPVATSVEPSPLALALSECALQDNQIRCADQHYHLLGNLPNSKLNLDIAELVLDIPAFDGDQQDMGQVQAYVSQSYREYVQKMVQLGLAASTMSYTKFFHTFQQVDSLGADFAGRMATMFEFLKRDKATIGVQDHYTNKTPTHISQCMPVNFDLVVCDDVATNWVYQRQ